MHNFFYNKYNEIYIFSESSIEISGDLEACSDSKSKHKFNAFHNSDKRLQNSDTSDPKRIKLFEGTASQSSNENKITNKSFSQKNHSDIVTDCINETTSFTKVYSTPDNSDKVTLNRSVDNLERASNGDDPSVHHYNHCTTVIDNIKSIVNVEDEIKSFLFDIIDKVEKNIASSSNKSHSKPKIENELDDKSFDDYSISDRIKAYVDQYKGKDAEILGNENKKNFAQGNYKNFDKELKNLCVEVTHDNVRLQNIISTFQNQQQKIIANVIISFH